MLVVTYHTRNPRGALAPLGVARDARAHRLAFARNFAGPIKGTRRGGADGAEAIDQERFLILPIRWAEVMNHKTRTWAVGCRGCGSCRDDG